MSDLQLSAEAQRRADVAERMRRSRARRRAGMLMIQIEIRAREIDALARRRLLDEVKRAEAGAVSNALGRFLDNMLG